jgi:hypothetical protein
VRVTEQREESCLTRDLFHQSKWVCKGPNPWTSTILLSQYDENRSVELRGLGGAKRPASRPPNLRHFKFSSWEAQEGSET